MGKKSSKIDCNFIEKIIFQTAIDDLNEPEKSGIMDHINTCENCHSSNKIMNIIKDSLSQELSETQLNPNPAIKASLIHNLKSETDAQNSIIKFIRNFFELKVPLYQAVTALILIGAFSFFINNNSQNLESFNNNISIIAAIDSNSISMKFQNSLELIDSYKKGISIMEDSVLSSFVQSSM